MLFMTASPQHTDPALIERLRRQIKARGVLDIGADWQPLSGGRTNRTWRVEAQPGRFVVVKLYAPATDNPLFQNNPKVEGKMLTWLASHDIAPRRLDAFNTSDGPCLVYRYISGTNWKTGVAMAARSLYRVHHVDAPDGLPCAPDGSAALADQTRAILDRCTSNAARAAANLAPSGPPVAPSERGMLLHGDPVPGNMIVLEGDVHYIDWQCPAIGDPCNDLAIFLSPAMQITYRGHSLSPVEREAFLVSYPCADTVARYRVLAPWYHWRMLAYCLWRYERGDKQARSAAQAEQMFLRQASQY